MFAFLHKWHRHIGIIIALFVVLLIITGIALNHSHELKLNKSYIKSDWLLNIYQINPDKEPIGFKENNLWISQIGERVYFNKTEIAKDIEELVGVITIGDIFVVAVDGQLTLLTQEGEIVEHISGADGVPAGMRKIGKSGQEDVIIKAAHGFYQVDIDELEWEEFKYLDAIWSEKQALPDELEQALLKIYRGTGLSLERVLLDLHSGRILGTWGVYLVDLIAILLLLLALSGAWMWWARR